MGLIQTIKEKLSPGPDRWEDARLVDDATREEMTPSGRYRLVIRYYDQGKDYWRYSRGTVYRVSDGAEVADVKRNYSTFHHSFVVKDGEEYLISGRSYMGQTLVNLDRGVEHNDKDWKGDKYVGVEFCWAEHALSPDGNTLLVDGCVWAAPYEYRFYDFTDPASRGWPDLTIVGMNGEPTSIYANSEGKKPEFIEDIIVCYETTKVFKRTGQREDDISVEQMGEIGEAYDDDENWEDLEDARIVLRRVGNEMRIVEWWKSEHKQEQERRSREFSKKFDEKVAAFHKTDWCRQVFALAERHDIPTQHMAGWRPWKKWEVSFSLRRKEPRASADLTWETEGSALIEVRIYDATGNNPVTTTFPNDAPGFKQALQRVEETFLR